MTAPEFQTALAVALRLCRGAAALRLPIEAMLAHVDDGLAGRNDAYAGEDTHGTADLEALRTILEAVSDVASIGSRLSPEPTPIRIPTASDGAAVPMPTNVTT